MDRIERDRTKGRRGYRNRTFTRESLSGPVFRDGVRDEESWDRILSYILGTVVSGISFVCGGLVMLRQRG